MAQLKEKVPALRWVDFDKGQLESSDRPSVAFPCALLTISVNNARNITDYIQDCAATLSVRLAFDQQMKTDSATLSPFLKGSTATGGEGLDLLSVALEPYDVIADVYAALQGFALSSSGGVGGGFDPLTRTRQGKENSRNGLFIYTIHFSLTFEDETANG